MKFKAKFLGIPVAILAAVAVIWLLMRRVPAGAQNNAPNTSASGLPQYTPQTQAYNVAPYQSAPSPGMVLLAPANPYDMGPGNDAYLKYNLGSNLDASKQPAKVGKKKCGDNCGCNSCSDCSDVCSANNAHWPDGRGGCMASSPRRQVAAITDQNPSTWDNWLNTLSSSNIGDAPMFDLGLSQQYDRAKIDGSTVPTAPRYQGFTYTGNAYVA